MKFLLDECLSARLTARLTDAGHDCVHVQQRGLLGASDEAVMAAAVAESRVLVSMDTDFGALLAESNASLPSLVVFRRVGRTADEQAAVLLLNLIDIADDLEAGAIAVITNTEIRLRRLPSTRQRRPDPTTDPVDTADLSPSPKQPTTSNDARSAVRMLPKSVVSS